MRDSRRQQVHEAFINVDGDLFPLLDGRQLHVALHLEKEFRAQVEMEVCALIGSADKHHVQLDLVHQLVAHRR